jgi:hypothetical protein
MFSPNFNRASASTQPLRLSYIFREAGTAFFLHATLANIGTIKPLFILGISNADDIRFIFFFSPLTYK